MRIAILHNLLLRFFLMTIVILLPKAGIATAVMDLFFLF